MTVLFVDREGHLQGYFVMAETFSGRFMACYGRRLAYLNGKRLWISVADGISTKVEGNRTLEAAHAT